MVNRGYTQMKEGCDAITTRIILNCLPLPIVPLPLVRPETSAGVNLGYLARLGWFGGVVVSQSIGLQRLFLQPVLALRT